MTELILHHHDPSPFAEKIRLVFGLKGPESCSVRTPMVMPRPALTPLTGGYRKVPVLQFGADVYCDKRLNVAELERRCPEPAVFRAGSLGIALALATWSDRSFFDPGAGLSLGLNKALIPAEVIEDRRQFFNFMDFDRLGGDVPHLFTQFRANLPIVELMPADGRSCVLGDCASFADVDACVPAWMARGNIGAARQRVQVTPDDYGRIAVEGELATLTLEEVAVRHSAPEAGEVVVHFPRLGDRIEPAA